MDGDEEPRPGNFDRAWNDPPLFNYKANAQPPTNGSKLNKRVNYPATTGPPPISPGLASTGPPRLHDAGAKANLSNMPPPPPPSAVAPIENLEVKKSVVSPNVPDQMGLEDRESALETFRALLVKIEPNVAARKALDIRKRLETLESKWNEGTLTFPVEKGLVLLSAALQSSNYDEADKIQRKLMVDWPSQCGTWLVGIKHLIMEANRLTQDEKES